MSEKVLSPDLGFVKEVIKAGGQSLKKCYQCATCTVVCNVTPEESPFPRKEMVQAQWGLKEELFANPDIWLCHQCSDCTAYCPRGAKPGEVLNAVRRLSLKEFAPLGFLASLAGSPGGLLLLLAVPVVLFLVILGALGNLGSVPRAEDGSIAYHLFMPVLVIDIVFIAAALFAVLVWVAGLRRYWRLMCSRAKPVVPLSTAVLQTVKEILAHRRFGKCEVAKGRSLAHLLVFYSFVALAITTTWALVYLYGFHRESPYPLSDPVKWLGNLGALGLLAGMFLVILNRLGTAAKAGLGSYYDWLFIVVVAGVGLTGFLSEIFRLADAAALAYPTYFAHLVLVFFLFAYAPYSKMAHMLYRALAMVFERATGRK
jgi:quinone-modifying oxidoreductase subunit QmoC